MQELHIETAAQLQELCGKLRGSSWLALDTEFIREKTYYPHFCLLQISNGTVAASVDPLAIDDMSELVQIIYDHDIVKVFHAGRQDLEIFHQLWGKLPQPLFDTQLAATLLGLGSQIGYGNLVQKVIGRELEKGHSRTDWSRRPLSQDQLRYALDDVIYLGDIYLNITDRLNQLGRNTWLQEDFDTLTDPATYSVDPQGMWKRIKGNQHLKGVQLAVLQKIAAWREQQAESSNRPRRWILKDEVLVDLARLQPGDIKGLERIRGLEAGSIKRHGDTLLNLIKQARQLPKTDWPKAHVRGPKLSANQEAIADLLQCCLRLIAEQEEITPAALANRKDLEQLAIGNMDSELLHGWRKALVGDAMLEVLDGRSSPQLDEGRLKLVRHVTD
ncbi:MAG: ribonuclease D [Gammaproteobacteria bacterium]|nr:ribonuclease D [Gammaproteobacteria bacterium]